MAVSLYMGVMGSGKTYEVVYSVIIPAVSAGRRVITNIKGINEEKIHEYCRSKFKTKQPGRVVFASTDEILKDDFFPFYSDDESLEQKAAFCEYGDLICLDELWSIWPSDSKLSEAHKRFISMHRHMTHAVSGVSCDLVIINQGVDGVPRYLKERIESTYRMTKLKSLGLSKSYRVDVFSGAKVFKNNKVSTRNYQYKKAVFELYKSYETTNGMEATTDSRQNVFSSAFLWVKIAFLLFIVLASIYSIRTVWVDIRGESVPEPKHTEPEVVLPSSEKIAKPDAPYSKRWRIAGELKSDYVSKVVLTDSNGRFRTLPANQFDGEGFTLSGIIDGEIVTYFTGG
ncbi:TPA: hypothetical protein F6V56_14020 [Escherichia coli]|nr:hypothetical protein [Escherichia coli]